MTSQFDKYYMDIAMAIRDGAKCLGSRVGAVVVVENRILTTGYNGTPEGFPNCDDVSQGCVRCSDSNKLKLDPRDPTANPHHTSGNALDRCICVHAEQNALLTAARFGVPIGGSTLYSTLKPCFTCLKEAIQAGVRRIVYQSDYGMGLDAVMQQQYDQLSEHLGAEANFTQLT